MWFWALGGIFVAAGLIMLRQYAAGSNIHRPLASRQPPRAERQVPLGMEATDLEHVSRATRRNESLERGQTNWLRTAGFLGRPDTDIDPLADDETYAARYHAAFHQKQSKD